MTFRSRFSVRCRNEAERFEGLVMIFQFKKQEIKATLEAHNGENLRKLKSGNILQCL